MPVRGFSWLCAQLEQVSRQLASGDVSHEDVLVMLRTPRPNWRPQTWEEELLRADVSWEPYKAADDAAAHAEDPAAAAWLGAFARAANLGVAQAARVARSWNQDVDFAARREQRPGDTLRLRRTACSLGALQFYYSERVSRIACQCWLAVLFTRDADAGLRSRLSALRAPALAALGDPGRLALGPATGSGAAGADLFALEREQQTAAEQAALLRLLVTLDGVATPQNPVRDLYAALQGGLATTAADTAAAGGAARREHLLLLDALCIWGLLCLRNACPREPSGAEIGGAVPALEPPGCQDFMLRVQERDTEARVRLAPLRGALLMVAAANASAAELGGARRQVAAEWAAALHTLHQLAMWGPESRGATAAPICAGECEYLRRPACETVRWALEWGCAVQACDAVKLLPLPMSSGRCNLRGRDGPAAHWTAPMLRDLACGLALVAPRGKSGGAPPGEASSPRSRDRHNTLSDYFTRAFGPLLAEVADSLAFLFSVDASGTQALLELLCASHPRVLHLWWNFLSRLPHVVVEAGPADPATLPVQQGEAELQLTPAATLANLLVLASDDGAAQLGGASLRTSSLGCKSWDSDVVPGIDGLYGQGFRELFESLAVQPVRRYLIWDSPDVELKGILWMCKRCCDLIKRGSAADPLHPQSLDLASAIIRTFRVFVCGPLSHSPEERLQHFTRSGWEYLNKIERILHHVRDEIAGPGAEGWSLVETVGDLLVQVLDRASARSYEQHSRLVQECADFLACLIALSRQVEPDGQPPVSFAVQTCLRFLFVSSPQRTRPPLLDLFWVVEPVSKRRQCTLAVLALASDILAIEGGASPVFGHVADYVCEVFMELGSQWAAGSDEGLRLSASCLEIVESVVVQAGVERTLEDGSRPHAVARKVLDGLMRLDRMGRALLEALASSCREVPDGHTRRSAAARAVAATALRVLELALDAAAELSYRSPAAAGLPLIALLLDPCASVPSNSGEELTFPALLFHLVAHGAEGPGGDLRVVATQCFALLCKVAPAGSLLRQVGGSAQPTGRRIMRDLKAVCAAPGEADGPADSSQDATRTTRTLAVLRMLKDVVTHQPRLFVEAFMSHGRDSDPVGTLLQHFSQDPDRAVRPAVLEAVTALAAAAVQAKEPCGGMVFARAVPSLLVQFTASGQDLGCTLDPDDGGDCPWHRLPRAASPDFKAVHEALSAASVDGGPVPCCVLDRARSWTQLGLRRFRHAGDKDGDDTVTGQLALVVGPVSSQPARGAKRADVLRAVEEALVKAFAAAGHTDVNVHAGWLRSEPISDPLFWPTLVDVLGESRCAVSRWLAGGRGVADGIATHVSTAAHALRTLTVAVHHGWGRGGKATDEDAALARATRTFAEAQLGKWGQCGDDGAADSVLGMFISTNEGGPTGSILSMAAGAFYGAVRVRVPTRPQPDQRRPPSAARGGRPSGLGTGLSPRKALDQPGTPMVTLLSPMMPGPAVSPAWDCPVPRQGGASRFPDSPGPAAPEAAPGAAPERDELRITLYDLIDRSEAEVREALAATGVVAQLASPEESSWPAALALARLRARARPAGHCPPADLAAWVDLRALCAVYGEHTALLAACTQLNEAATLGASALYLLRSAAHLVRALLSAPCPSEGPRRRLIPPRALLRPADWDPAAGPAGRARAESACVARILLEQCLAHPARREATDPAWHPPVEGPAGPGASLSVVLEQRVRSECARLLAASLYEVVGRVGQVAAGALDPAEAPLGPRERLTAHGAVAASVCAVLANTGATQGAARPGAVVPRGDRCTTVEAEMLQALCALADPDPASGGTLPRQYAGADPAHVFPYLQQYLMMPGDLGGAQGACRDAALQYLCTFKVPDGMQPHAVQLARTFLGQLRELHTKLSGQIADSARGPLAGRALLVLCGLRAIAESRCAAEVLVECGALQQLGALPRFAPPASDAAALPPAVVAAEGVPGVKATVDARDPLPSAHDARPAEWVPLRNAVLGVVAALLASVERQPLPAAAAAVAQLRAYCGGCTARLEWLLTPRGLRSGCGQERAWLLSLLVGCARLRMRDPAAAELCVGAPLYEWLPPLLAGALAPLREAVKEAALRAIRAQLAANPTAERTSYAPRAQGPLAHAAGQQRQGEAEGAVRRVARYEEELQLYVALAHVVSLMRMHLVVFLSVATPAAGRGPSRPLAQLLAALEHYHACGGQDDALEERVHWALRNAVLHAPEPGVEAALKQFARGKPAAAPRKRRHDPVPDPEPRLSYMAFLGGEDGRRLAWELRCALVEQFTSTSWAAAAGRRANCSWQAYADQPPIVLPHCFADVAVLGNSDDAADPGQPLRLLAEELCSRLCDIVVGEPCGQSRVHRRGCPQPPSAFKIAKAAAEAISATCLLHESYLRCAELAAPDEGQLLGAANALAGLDPAVMQARISGLAPSLRRQLQQRIAQLPPRRGERESPEAAALRCFELRELAKRCEREGEALPLWLQKLQHRLRAAAAGPALGDSVRFQLRGSPEKGGVLVGCAEGKHLVRPDGETLSALVDARPAAGAAPVAAGQRARLRALLADPTSGLAGELGERSCGDPPPG
eukprot:TRINITY_DN7929_c0_g1_i1.p1 TRINITY_DN7929_c0_g1~~TRINITY_DN7929_c0_g1_i1.p1  ORF type:complete len:2567 (+),score=617.46 TRINITY_DN7929_c0_g1_i1:97-7797(+)